jgi:catechol 2,3-dioxygenase-like lactoylglutathione lyase family enzyme
MEVVMAESNGGWPGPIEAITLFTEDLEATKRFYAEVFGLPIHFEDDASAVFKFSNTLINLLTVSEAPELIAPAPVASPGAGNRFQFTLAVDDVDAMCDELQRRGVELLNGPMDRPWGIRTAAFRDPAGHIWEIAK